MARKAGSKIIPCPQCKKQVVGIQGDRKECPSCGKKFMVSKKYLKELGKL